MMQEATSVSDGHGPGPSTLKYARRIVLLQYEARLPPTSSAFVWPPGSILLRAQAWLDRDLFGENKVGSSRRYRTLFLRELCARLDAAVQVECELLRSQGVDEIEFPEVDAALLERYVEAMAGGSSRPVTTISSSTPDDEFTTHYWPCSGRSQAESDDDDDDLLDSYASVTIREEGSAISKGTTGLRTWEAGLRLAGHLVSEPSLVTSSGARVVELGSGAGFVGAVCAKLQVMSTAQVARTFMTDMPGQVITRINDTLATNGLDSPQSCVEVHELDWLEISAERQQSRQRDDLPMLNFLNRAKPSLVLAADVVYDPDLIGPLVESIRACLEAGTRECQALVASTIRNADTYGAFKASLSAHGLSASVVELRCPVVPIPGDQCIDMPDLRLFPSVHDSALHGRVELLCVRLE